MGQFEAIIGVNFWTALAVLLNTLTIFFVAKKFLFKPVMKMISDRQKEIDDMYAQADKTKLEAEELHKSYTQKLSVATETGEQLVREAVARGQNRQEQIIRQANEEAAAMLKKAEADIAQEKKKAVNEAKNEISDMALSIAEKVVGRQIQDEDRNKLFDEFLDGLGYAQ